MSSVPVSYSKSVGVLSCVSIIAQSWTIDKVYLISRLQNVELEPWNCYFLSKLLFQSLYFLKALTYTLGVHRVMHYSENLSIKYHDQNFYIKTATSGQHWTGQTIGECEKSSFWGNLIKISILVLCFSTESAEKPTI